MVMLLTLFIFSLLLLYSNSDVLKLPLKSGGPKSVQKISPAKSIIRWGSNDLEEYTISIAIGTPPQKFELGLSLYAAETIIADVSIIGMDTNQSISGFFTCFDSSKSSTYSKDGQTFGDEDSDSRGFYGTDTVYFGDSDPIVIEKAIFGQITEFSTWPLGGYDGILGLGITQYDKKNNVDSFLTTAFKEKVIDKPIFTVWLFATRQFLQPLRGQVTIGDIDKDYCSDKVIYAKVSGLNNVGHFLFKIDNSVVGEISQNGQWNATVLIEQPFTDVPDGILQDIVKMTNAKFDPSFGLYSVDCKVKFKWTISFNGQKLTINEKSGVVEWYEDTCFLAFKDAGNQFGSFVFGQSLALEYCYVFEMSGNGRIGFSKMPEK